MAATQQQAYGQIANYNLSPGARADGQSSALEVDSKGNLFVAPGVGYSFGASTADQATFTSATTTGGIAMGVYQTTPDTIATGKAAAVGIDTNRNLKVTEATKLAGEDLTNDVMKVEQRFSYQNITTNATTTVKTGSGYIDHITINNPALITVANLTMTVYDNTAGSGTKIGTFTIPFGLTTAVPFDIPFHESFATGLTIVTAGPTVTADITVAYR